MSATTSYETRSNKDTNYKLLSRIRNFVVAEKVHIGRNAIEYGTRMKCINLQSWNESTFAAILTAWN